MRRNKVFFVAWRFFVSINSITIYGYGNLIRMNYITNPDFGQVFYNFQVACFDRYYKYETIKIYIRK